MPKTAAKNSEVSDGAAILSVIAGSPMVRKELQAQADQQTAARQTLFSELSALDAAGATERSTYEAAIGKAREAIAVVEARMREAIQIAVRIQSEHDASRFSRDGRRAAIEAELRAAANPVLDAFRSWLMDEDARICREPVEFLQIGETRNAVTGRRTTATVITNKLSIDARLAAVRAALRQIDDLKMLPDQRTIPAIIVEIKEGLPEIMPPKAPKDGGE